jgi:tetratricopeptide (TPR) repeat protein
VATAARLAAIGTDPISSRTLAVPGETMRQAWWRRGTLCALMLLVGCSEPSAPAPPQQNAAEGKSWGWRDVEHAYLPRVEQAIALGEGEDYAAADRALDEVIGHASFASLEPSMRNHALALAAYAAMQLDQHERALERIGQAIDADAADPYDWRLRSYLERELGRHDDAAAHFAHVARVWPDQIEDDDLDTVSVLMRDTGPESDGRFALLQALFDANFTPPHQDVDWLWHDLALRCLERDRTACARTAIARIQSPMDLIRLRSDKRFDALVDRAAPAFDVERIAASRLQALKLQAQSAPDDPDLVIELLHALLRQGAADEAAEVSGALIARARDDADLALRLERAGNMNWILNLHASAHAHAGRFDQAIAQLERAIRLGENGVRNVSQVLNLAAYHAGLERPDEALALLDKVGEMSGYGRMVYEFVRHRAAVLKQDAAIADAALAYLREHMDDNALVLVDALVDADRVDEAAATLVRLLESERHRSDALLVLQEFRRPVPVPLYAKLEPRWNALRAHPDVQRALDAVGRSERYGILDW